MPKKYRNIKSKNDIIQAFCRPKANELKNLEDWVEMKIAEWKFLDKVMRTYQRVSLLLFNGVALRYRVTWELRRSCHNYRRANFQSDQRLHRRRAYWDGRAADGHTKRRFRPHDKPIAPHMPYSPVLLEAG